MTRLKTTIKTKKLHKRKKDYTDTNNKNANIKHQHQQHYQNNNTTINKANNNNNNTKNIKNTNDNINTNNNINTNDNINTNNISNTSTAHHHLLVSIVFVDNYVVQLASHLPVLILRLSQGVCGQRRWWFRHF